MSEVSEISDIKAVPHCIKPGLSTGDRKAPEREDRNAPRARRSRRSDKKPLPVADHDEHALNVEA